MGVKQLPILAATVCRITVIGIRVVLPATFKTVIAKGTKVIRATSFVIIPEKKKHKRVKIRIMLLVFFALESRWLEQRVLISI